MDVFTSLPTMKASDLVAKAAEFADTLVSELDAFNKKYPAAQLDQGVQEYLHRTFPAGVHGPNPQDYRGAFEAIFCRYIASRWVVIPD